MIGFTNKQQQQNMAKEEIIIDGEEGTGEWGEPIRLRCMRNS